MKLMHNRKLYNQGFTLVELLLVVAIIAVLSTLAVGVMGSASNDAKAAATRSRVLLIGQVLQTQLEEYEVRRIPFGGNILNLTDKIIANGTWADRRDPSMPLDPVSNPSIRQVHFRNLKRMFLADLVRSEIPNGRANGPFTGPSPGDRQFLGEYPTPALTAYLTTVLGIPAGDPDLFAISTYELSGGIARWNGWDLDFGNPSSDPSTRDDEQRFADAAELLHEYLLRIDYNGSSALDALGSTAIADTDGDGRMEIVDSWGDPIYFQFHQPNITAAPLLLGIWTPPAAAPDATTDLEVVLWDDPDTNSASQVHQTIKPVRIDQLFPFVSSTKLLEIDGVPVEYSPL